MVSMSLPAAIAISMALNHSDHMPNGGLQSSMLFPDKRSFYTSKECEFRFHHREEDLSDRILALLKENPL